MIEKWKSAVDSGKSFGALLTNPSKTFNGLPHKLLLATLNASGFSLSICSYLFNRQQMTKLIQAIPLGKKSSLNFRKDPV